MGNAGVTVKSSVSLTDRQHAFAKSLVQDGRYASVSAVLQQGIEMLRHRLEREDAEKEALMLLLSRRRHGDFVESDAMGQRVREMAARKRRAHGLPD